MNWRRIHQKEKDSRHYKEWQADRGRYRIIWRDEVCGIAVRAGYQCCMQVTIQSTGKKVWDIIDRNRYSLYRTLNAAKTACEKHARKFNAQT